MERLNIEISWSTLWKVSLFVLFVTILIIGKQVILALFLALAISSGLEFIISFLTNHKIPRTLAVISVFLLAAFLLATMIYFVLPFVIADLSLAISSLGNSSLGEWIRPFIQGNDSFITWAQKISSALISGKFGSLSTVQGVFSGAALAVTVLMASFYLSLSKDGVERFLQAILPEDWEEKTLRIYTRSVQKISWWLRSQMIMSLIVGVLFWAALFLLNVRHSLVLGIIAAIFEIMPFVGPILAGGLAVMFALITSPSLALYTLIAFVVIQQFESNVLVPIVSHKAIGIHPVVVIIAILIGVEAAGFLGILVAVPAAAVFQEIVEDRALRKIKA